VLREQAGAACKGATGAKAVETACDGIASRGDDGRRKLSAALVVRCMQAKRAVEQQQTTATEPPVEVAFYRKYTEGMLRRYMYRSMEIGRVPSLLGDFSFRGKSSNRRGYTFEDAVIFVHDVERCLTRLNAVERELVGRIALQEYTLMETAELTGMSVRTVVRRYSDALDRLTRVFLRLKLLQVPGAR
jgi:Sigma-70, region 4